MKLDEAIQMKNVLESEITALLMEFTEQTGLLVKITSEYSHHIDKYYYGVEAEVRLI